MAKATEGNMLSCQSDGSGYEWKVVGGGELKVRAVRSRISYSRGSTVATCADDEVVVGGGGYCDWSQGYGFSGPSGNGWGSGCMEWVKNYTWAMCAKR